MWRIRMQRMLRTLEGRVVILTAQYLSVLSLLSCHPSSNILSHFFQDKTDLLCDFIYMMRTGKQSSCHYYSLIYSFTHSFTNSRLDVICLLASLSCSLVLCLTSSSILITTGPGSSEYSQQPSTASSTNTPTTPLSLRVLACECLTAIVSSRDSSSVSVMGKFSWLQSDLGVARGHYMGLLPCLLRSATSFIQSLATTTTTTTSSSLGSRKGKQGATLLAPPVLMGSRSNPSTNAEDTRGTGTGSGDGDGDGDSDGNQSKNGRPVMTPRKQNLISQSLKHLPDVPTLLSSPLHLHGTSGNGSGSGRFQYLPASDATSTTMLDDKVACLDRLAWIEHVFMLTMSLVTVTNALPALAENGLVSLLVSVLKLPPVSVPAVGEGDPLVRQLALRRTYVTGLLTQLLEQAIGSHGPSMTMFNEVKGFECTLHRLADELDELDMTSYVATVKSAAGGAGAVPSIPEQSAEMMMMQIEEEEEEEEEKENGGVESTSAGALRVDTREQSLSSPAGATTTSTSGTEEDEEEEKEEEWSDTASSGSGSGSSRSPLLVVSIHRPEHISAASTIMLHSLLTLATYFLQQSTQGKILREKLFSQLLLKIFSNMAALDSAISASSFILFSDVINNDPSILSHLIGNGVAECCLNACSAHNTVRHIVPLTSSILLYHCL